MVAWMEAWGNQTTGEWVHLFTHALGPIPTAWYLDAELHKRTRHLETLKNDFIGTFILIGGFEALDEALQDIDTFVFGNTSSSALFEMRTWETQMQDIFNCCNLEREEGEDDLRFFSILESEGERAIEGPPLKEVDVTKPLKLREVNIGMKENPNLAKIGDYWDENTVGKVAKLLTEYQHFFNTKFSKLKGIMGDLRVIHVTLKLDAWPIK